MKNWPLMRDDLSLVRNEDNGETSWLVRDPVEREVFEFGSEEVFLLNCLDGEKGPVQTIADFEQRFKMQLNITDLNEFIRMVEGWGLLRSGPDLAPAPSSPPAERPSRPTEDEILAAEIAADSSEHFSMPDADNLADPFRDDEDDARSADEVEDDLSLEDLGLAPDGGLGGMGGMGGMRGMGAMRGMGGLRGGMGGGMGGAMGGMAGMGRRGGGPGGPGARMRPGMANGRGPRAAPAQPVEKQWHLFDPTGLLKAVNAVYGPFRFVLYLLPVLLIGALFALFNNLTEYVTDFERFRAPLTIFQNLVFSMFTVNLGTQLVAGASAQRHGAEVPSLGIKMVLGLLPRFSVQTEPLVDEELRDAQIWFHAGALIARVTLFSLAVLLWLASRSTGTMLPGVFLMLTVVSLISFFLSANPLINGNGYALVTSLAGIRNLRQKANRALFSGSGSRRRGITPEQQEENRTALRVYALSSLIFLVALLGTAMYFAARWLEYNLRGLGVVIFLLLMTILVLRFRRNISQRRDAMLAMADHARQMRGAGPAGGTPGRQLQVRPRSAVATPVDYDDEEDEHHGGFPWLRLVLLGGLIVVAFLPYSYETGGPLEILPMQRREVYAEVAGFVTEVRVPSGNYAKKGDVIATLSATDQQKNVETTRAALQEARAKLDELLNSPRPDEVQLAQQKLDTARTQFRFSSDAAERMRRVYEKGTISLEMFEDAKRKMEVDKAQVQEEEANLRRVKSGPHPSEIDAARAEVLRLDEQLKFYAGELGRTDLFMPFDGRLVTLDLEQMVGRYMNKGELFTVVENDTSVRIDMDITETDIGEVQLGDVVRIKIWAYPDRTFEGTVSEIAPVVEQQSYGKVVRVSTIIENPDGMLKSGMTGYGKVDGGTKPVYVAFSRMLVRFFQIEIWSWIP